ncbi:MAG: Rrf2 family transcriptional regulator [Ancylobacter novellus]|uniref:Rrf2 family transcriptional regulator n=1 Tax=Ancylobacter novellus TaxID=921 RepID=A0A2W5KP53_ANCNO|nr:MAG: Rrf2 family transcriptional regulator [Ancylobacter novellus]
MITQKAKYALKALLALARAQEGRPSSIRDLAARETIPQSFLEQILIELRRAGVVESRRGKEGGYLLARSPSEVRLGQVLRIIDGPLAPLPCLSRTAYRRCPDCADEAACTVRRIFEDMYEATVEIMDRTTLADALERPDLADAAPQVKVINR